MILTKEWPEPSNGVRPTPLDRANYKIIKMKRDEKKRIKQAFFDLDGTLIDSAPSILESLQFAFEKAGIKPNRLLTQDLIGPPLAVAIKSLLTTRDHKNLPVLVDNYKEYYDEIGYRKCGYYEGVPDMLKELRHMGLDLYIVTNKRKYPTERIVSGFGWESFFTGLYTLDSFEPMPRNKEELFIKLRAKNICVNSDSIYLGDRFEDANAAISNKIRFFRAAWGYGNFGLEDGDYETLSHPQELTEIFKKINLIL